MKIPIDEITVRPGRREAVPGIIMDLTESMAEVGLLNPVTVSADYVLIAGLHRLEAAKSLGWTEVECHVCDLEGPQMELAEVDENCVRTNMTTLERA
ncbi:MAG: ParB N-terminal domain-containing protein, partial [Oscillibacter sp.]|nr:ParB N-terminal domain-containing protein [Oscillibacter sp.]